VIAAETIWHPACEGFPAEFLQPGVVMFHSQEKITVPVKAIPRFFIVLLIAFWALSISAFGQTFEINQQPSNPSANTTAKKGKKTGKSPSTPSTGLGWGSSIEVGRM